MCSRDQRQRIVALGRDRERRPFAIGPGQPLRVVAPFGYTSDDDLGTDLTRRVQALADVGADAVQELSTYGPYADERRQVIAACPVPYGTVLAYEVYDRFLSIRHASGVSLVSLVVDVLEKQLVAGVDYVTVHASLSRDLMHSTAEARSRRAIPMSSRAGGLLLTIMQRAGTDNPIHDAFPEILALARDHGAVLSLGSTLRPAAIADTMDSVHQAELNVQGHLARRAHDAGVPTLIEGLSHGLPHDVGRYIDYASAVCDGAPITALGPLPVDIAVGKDDVAFAIGLTLARRAGLALCNVVSATEHVAMPSESAMLAAIRNAKLAAYVADAMACGRTSPRDRAMSVARSRLDWSAQTTHALFPDLLSDLLERTQVRSGQPCTICGRRCPLMGIRVS